MIPGFMLATLNPGKRTRHKRRKARRNGKRFNIAAFMAKRRAKRHPKMAKAVKIVVPKANSRRRLRRLNGLFGRRSVMARVRRRARRARKNAWSGARSSRRRVARKGKRSRRNPWSSFRVTRWRSKTSGQFGKRKRARRNPLWLARMKSGRRKFIGLPSGRLMHRRRSGRGRGRWHNNSVLPFAASLNGVLPITAALNPRRRRHGRRRYSANPRRRSRRSYRRNSVLPVSWNPAGSMLADIPVTKFIDPAFLMNTALPAAGGFIGTRALSGMAYNAMLPYLPAMAKEGIPGTIVKIANEALVASLLGWGVGKFLSKQAGQYVFLGGVVAVTYTAIQQILPAIGVTIPGMAGFGEDALTARMRQAVAAQVQARLSGLGHYQTVTDLDPQRMAKVNGGLGAHLTREDMGAQSNYSASPTAPTIADYDPFQEGAAL
jgi:hypothetical protein